MANKIDLILHPVRLRILTAISGRKMTAQELAIELPDVAQATLYRHISALIKGGLLDVVEENQIRGTVEKTYSVTEHADLNLTEEDLRDASKDDHMRYFTTFLMTHVAEYSRYLQQTDEINLAEDGVGYHTLPLYISDDELPEFSHSLRHLMHRYANPTSDKPRRLFSFVIMPSVDDER
jgi:DNA-binding transcriptional ArsR family regulator